MPFGKMPKNNLSYCECDYHIPAEDFQKKLRTCPKCGYHFRISAEERIKLLTDNYEELWSNLKSADPLNFNGTKTYIESLRIAEKKTKINDAIITVRAVMGNHDVALGAFDFNFMGGSMGSVVGEKIKRLTELAETESLPLIIVSSSGGARMQEGVLSLMQMAKTSAAIKKYKKIRKPYISILTSPTTGGTLASFASLADIIIAEEKAYIGFTGRRVIEQTINVKVPDKFQTSESNLEHGQIDRIVHRIDLKEEVINILNFLSGGDEKDEKKKSSRIRKRHR